MIFWFRDLLVRAYMLICRVYPIDKKKVVFKSDRGGGCTDSPLALFEMMSEKYPDYKAIWVLKDISRKPAGCKAVKEGSLAEVRALATAGIWVDNKRKGCWTVKRKGQTYIQTWHGPIALKRVEKDIEDKLPAYYVKSCKHDSKLADYFLSGSKWTTQFYRSSFWYEGEILEFGVPRNDKFFRDPVEFVEKVNNHYGIQSPVNLVLYAPTFRDDGRRDVYCLDYYRLLKNLQKQFGGDWKILVRMHPNMQSEAGIVSFDQNVLNGNSIEDIGDLIMACKILITDYSSCMFDAMEAGKTVMIFSTDIDQYRNDRGFAIPMEELPFQIAKTNDELEENILSFNKSEYTNRVSNFSNKIGILDDGNASIKILHYLLDSV